jgi:hypothetical protein
MGLANAYWRVAETLRKALDNGRLGEQRSSPERLVLGLTRIGARYCGARRQAITVDGLVLRGR